MEDNTGSFSERTDDMLRIRSVRYSLICIFIVVLLILLSIAIINTDRSLLKYDLHIFGTNENGMPAFSYMSDGLAGDGIKIGVKSFEVSGGKAVVGIIGENRSGKEWKARGEAFMLSSFNTRAAEPRDHYYADNWENFTVPDGESFETALEFAAPEFADGTGEGYIFTLSVFRSGEYPALEIILTE